MCCMTISIELKVGVKTSSLIHEIDIILCPALFLGLLSRLRKTCESTNYRCRRPSPMQISKQTRDIVDLLATFE